VPTGIVWTTAGVGRVASITETVFETEVVV